MWLVGTWLIGMVAVSCTADSSATQAVSLDALPSVVVTTSIWADVVANVACTGLVEIVTVIPRGGDPHGFEPSLADRGRMEDAALVVANGLLLEESLDDTLASVADSGTPVFRIGEHIDTIAYGGHDAHDDDAHDGDPDTDAHHDDAHDGDPDADAHDDDAHDGDQVDDDDHDESGDGDASDGADPHVWTDPLRVAAVLPKLGQQLVEHAGLSPADVADCVADYAQRLTALDADIVALLDSLEPEHRKLVTNHDSLGYFADRYGFEVIGTVIPAPAGLAETSPAQLENLATLIDDAGVRAIFAESQRSSDDVEALAARLGDVEVVTLFTGTLGEPGSGADTYIGLLRTNAALIAEGLS